MSYPRGKGSKTHLKGGRVRKHTTQKRKIGLENALSKKQGSKAHYEEGR
jgi:hypothetical protein